MTDLVERLRLFEIRLGYALPDTCALVSEAADTIEKMSQELLEMRQTLLWASKTIEEKKDGRV